LRGRDEIHVSPKALDLLRILVENRSRAVSRADLQNELWPSTFVLDTNLASLVKEIRHALGDTAGDPRFVRTVHRFGYWFIGQLEHAVEGGDAHGAVRYWLIWEGRQLPLAAGENILGRSPDASVWIDISGVSRHHARIVVGANQVTMEDLRSKNGTYVGGRRISAASPLADGDQIRLGPVVITFRIPPPAGVTETAPAS